jgi:hypothetical protein
MKWDIYKAKAYMMRVAMDLIEDGMFASEGGRLIHEAKFNGGCDSQHRFIEVIQQILEWDLETISEALEELKK